jgi:hypothetical protein
MKRWQTGLLFAVTAAAVTSFFVALVPTEQSLIELGMAGIVALVFIFIIRPAEKE